MIQAKAISAIALNTLKGFIRDRIFYGILMLALGLVMFSILIADLTFVETQKILLDFGLATTSFSGVVISIIIGLITISKEIEKKIVYTILAKPISRMDFVLGKFIGCSLLVFLVHIFLSITLIIIIAQFGEGHMPKGMGACFYLMLLESLLMLAVGIFFSMTTSSSFLAGSLTVAVFLIGRSDTAILKILQKNEESQRMKTILRTFYDVFPSLGRFNIRELLAYGKDYPHDMIQNGSVYFFIYLILLLAATILIFEKKDIM